MHTALSKDVTGLKTSLTSSKSNKHAEAATSGTRFSSGTVTPLNPAPRPAEGMGVVEISPSAAQVKRVEAKRESKEFRSKVSSTKAHLMYGRGSVKKSSKASGGSKKSSSRSSSKKKGGKAASKSRSKSKKPSKKKSKSGVKTGKKSGKAKGGKKAGSSKSKQGKKTAKSRGKK